MKLAGKYSSCSLTSAPIRQRSRRSRARLVVQVVLDLDPLQMLGQLLPAVLVAVLHAAGDELLARFLFDARLVERHLSMRWPNSNSCRGSNARFAGRSSDAGWRRSPPSPPHRSPPAASALQAFDLSSRDRSCCSTMIRFNASTSFGNSSMQRHASCCTDCLPVAPAQVAKNQATRLDFTSSPDSNRSSCSGLISIAGLPVRGNWNSPRSSRL